MGFGGRAMLLAAGLVLSGCASGGNGRFLLVTDSLHGPVVWHRFGTREACEQARRESDLEMRCATRRALRAR